jgi:hypothetical protein
MLALVVILVLVGCVPCAIGVIFLRVYFQGRRTAALMQRAGISSAASVAGMQPGRVVGVTGTLRCPKPLTSEMARVPCAWARAWIERIYERDERDANGEWRTEEARETLGSHVRLRPFFVEDASGRVRVSPDGADVTARTSMDRFEEHPARGRARLGDATIEVNHGGRTIGYRFREEILPLDTPVYVLGVVTEKGEIARPDKDASDAAFIISYQTESASGRPGVPATGDDGWIKWGGIGTLALGGLFFAIAGAVWLIWG